MKYSKETNKLIQDIGLDEKNTGSSEAQIALLTDRIRSLTEHVKNNKKDEDLCIKLIDSFKEKNEV